MVSERTLDPMERTSVSGVVSTFDYRNLSAERMAEGYSVIW